MALPRVLVAQQRVGGIVLDSLGRPIAQVLIATSSPPLPPEHTAITDSLGHFVVAIPAAGSFVLSASKIGYIKATVLFEQRDAPLAAPQVIRLSRIPMSPTLLSTVETRARRTPVERRRDTPGETRGAEFAFMLDGRPIDAGNLNEIAATAPGVVAQGSGDEAGVSVAGQSSDRNHTSVDGSSFAGTSLPPEAVASAGIVLNAYDVSRGQYSGGELVATTRSGTSIWAGALRSSASPSTLRYATVSPAGTGDRVGSARIGGGGGGALVADRLFAFTSFDASRRTGRSSFLDPHDATTLARLGVSGDSAAAFVDAANRAGFSDHANSLAVSGSDNATVLTRLDMALGERHLATMRLDGTLARISGLGATPYSAAGTAGDYRAANGGVLFSLNSRDDRFTNDVRMYVSEGERRVHAGFAGAGASALSRGGEIGGVAGALTAFRVGGAPLGFTSGSRHFLEVADEIARGRDNGNHLWKAGGILNREVTRSAPSNPNGTYSFASIADFAELRASGFARGGQRDAVAAAEYAALYAGDTWHARSSLMLTYGARLERSWYPEAESLPSGAASVDSLLSSAGVLRGLQHTPGAELRVLPRVGFAYRPAKSPLSILGGAGLFRARTSAGALSRFLNERGVDGTLSCVGPAVRQPSVLSDPAIAASPCDSAFPSYVTSAAPVSLFASSFHAPVTYRASLDATWRFGRTAIVHFRPTVLRVEHEALASDLTLVHSAAFTLPFENERVVYAPVSSIDVISGASALTASRTVPGLGAVRSIRSDGRSATDQASLGVEASIPLGGALNLWYTYTNSRDMTSGVGAPGGGKATTGGDPATVEWAPKDFEQRHALLAEVRYDVSRHASVVATARLASGVPYTPMVSGDVNGDGSFNDRAYIVDPAISQDPTFAAAFARLLATAPSAVSSCLRAQMGRVAARNSCRTGWAPYFDAKINSRPLAFGSAQQISFSASMQNIAAAADYLTHGADRLHGWGQAPQPDNALFRVRGFDAQTRAFRYEVNPDFGTYGTSRSFHQPFLITVEARVTLGADPARQTLAALIAAARSAPRSPEELAPFLATRFPNVAAIILVNRDSLGLHLDGLQMEQLGRLARMAEDSLGAARRNVADVLGSVESARRATLPAMAAAAELIVNDVRAQSVALLSGAQRESLPASLRSVSVGGLVQPPIPLSLPNP